MKIPSAYDPNKNPLGDGQVDVESRLMLSRSWAFDPYEVDIPIARQAVAPPPPVPDQAPSGSHVNRQAVIRHAIAQAARKSGRVHWMPDAEASMPEQETDSFDRRAVAPIPIAAPPTPRETRYRRLAFMNVEGAFTARNEEPANEVPFTFEFGYTPLNRFMVVGSFESTVSIHTTDELEENFAKVGLRGILNVWGHGFSHVFRQGGPTVNVEAGYNDVVAGRNTADAFEVFGKIGVFF